MPRLIPLAAFVAGAVFGCLAYSGWQKSSEVRPDATPALNMTLASVESPATNSPAKKQDSPQLRLVPSPRRSGDAATSRPDARIPLTDRDRAMIAFQKTCPVCGETLDAKKIPGRIEISLYVCGKECIAKFDKQPRDAITKWAESCSKNSKPDPSRAPKESNH